MDAAFPTAKYPGYTTKQLKDWIAEGKGTPLMVAEIARRDAVEAGDWNQMTPAERLRAGRGRSPF